MTVAHRVTDHAQPAHATGVIVGEGWGCAPFGTPAEVTWQCWDAPGPGSGSPRAWTVPWLKNRALQAGPDRVCEFARPALTLRCWHRPMRGEGEGRELPANWEWLNPNHTKWEDSYSRSDRVALALVGGTFACLQATNHDSVWCLGDNGFGQLGGSSPIPAPDAPAEDPAFVQHLWPAWSLAVGTWHACAMAAPRGLAQGGHIACWGRGDAGQLGARAPDRCVVDGATIPCARSPQHGPDFTDAMAVLRAGDLFTCLSNRDGISCWGASRDGFFGEPGSCPETLRNAWPTLQGSVQAPLATCSLEPVRIPNVTGFQQSFQVAPRGLCFDDHDRGVQCLGGIRTPRGGVGRAMTMSPGRDASACGLRDGGVVCWGEAYSASSALDVPVPVVFEPFAPIRETAVSGPSDSSGWSAGCLIRQGCAFGPAPLSPCAPSVKSRAWSEVLPEADTLAGQVVSVRGPLGVGMVFSTMMGCSASDGRACCNHAGGPVVMGGSRDAGARGLLLCG
jgi:hypothetical protein